MNRSYRFELSPDSAQAALLSANFGCVRFVYNWGLEQNITAYNADKTRISRFELNAKLTQLKKEEATSWLSEANAQSLQYALLNLEKGFKSFFAKQSKFPVFKRKSNRQSLQIPQGCKVLNNRVYVPKIGWVKFFKSRDIPGKIKTVTITRTPSNRHYVIFTLDIEQELPPLLPITPPTAVGVDLGLKTLVTTSDGVVFENQRYYLSAVRKLRIAKRALARKTKGSNRYERQRLKVAKLMETIAFKRDNYLHNVSCLLTKVPHTLVVEDLNVAGIGKNRRLAKHVYDVGWGAFLEMLTYKCQEKGVNLLTVDRFFPSSKLCSKCGVKNDDLTLSDRIWTCPSCGVPLDRDINAAVNIKLSGLGMLPGSR